LSFLHSSLHLNWDISLPIIASHTPLIYPFHYVFTIPKHPVSRHFFPFFKRSKRLFS
jgi:hypothetical protein